MKQPFLICSLVAVTALSAQAQPAQSGGNYEMTLEGLGQSQTTLEIESWSWGAVEEDPPDADPKDKDGVKRKNTNGVQEVFIVVEQSPTSALLLDSMIAKKLLARVSLHSTGNTSKSFELAMKDVKLTSYQTGGSGGLGHAPMDQMALSFKTAKLIIGDGGTSHTTSLIGRTK